MVDDKDETKELREPKPLEKIMMDTALKDMETCGNKMYPIYRDKAETFIKAYDKRDVNVFPYATRFEEIDKERSGGNQNGRNS